ncbi:MAG: hypothetical protein L6N95_00350 [Candidatus Methylarchaceae archaeon HK01B]|nr:hypothetical protein [Candidatus Methylarchaceae archaeon HK01M]MCP8318262.1 hypothetical protein [Candidatus Methylarchaceae archaeon HK01B]
MQVEMVRKNCDICGTAKAVPCQRCGINVCRTHRDRCFDEKSQSFILLCRNCGRYLSAQRSPTSRTYRSNRRKYRYRW